MTKTRLTERQRYWLEHIRTCESRAMPLSDYAREHRLSLKALYNAKSRLRRRGAYEATDPVPQSRRFVRVNVSEGAQALKSSSTACRVHFSNGMMVELSVNLSEFAALFHSVATSS